MTAKSIESAWKYVRGFVPNVRFSFCFCFYLLARSPACSFRLLILSFGFSLSPHYGFVEQTGIFQCERWTGMTLIKMHNIYCMFILAIVFLIVHITTQFHTTHMQAVMCAQLPAYIRLTTGHSHGCFKRIGVPHKPYCRFLWRLFCLLKSNEKKAEEATTTTAAWYECEQATNKQQGKW